MRKWTGGGEAGQVGWGGAGRGGEGAAKEFRGVRGEGSEARGGPRRGVAQRAFESSSTAKLCASRDHAIVDDLPMELRFGHSYRSALQFIAYVFSRTNAARSVPQHPARAFARRGVESTCCIPANWLGPPALECPSDPRWRFVRRIRVQSYPCNSPNLPVRIPRFPMRWTTRVIAVAPCGRCTAPQTAVGVRVK